MIHLKWAVNCRNARSINSSGPRVISPLFPGSLQFNYFLNLIIFKSLPHYHDQHPPDKEQTVHPQRHVHSHVMSVQNEEVVVPCQISRPESSRKLLPLLHVTVMSCHQGSREQQDWMGFSCISGPLHTHDPHLDCWSFYGQF